MRKQEFLRELREKLAGLTEQDVEERINFYSEIIDDIMEEGKTEEKAVSDVGSIDELSSQIIADIPLPKIAAEKIKPKRRLRAWEITLLAIGSPIWLSLGIAALAVILLLYAVLWSLVVSAWAVFVSFTACTVGGVVAGIFFAVSGSIFSGLAMLSAGILLAGLSIFTFFGCKAATKGVIRLTKNIAIGLKKLFIKKEDT